MNDWNGEASGAALILTADAAMLPDGLAHDLAVLVSGATIAAIGPVHDIERANPRARRIDLPRHVIMPGFVNAHQHGCGLTSIQLGNPDDQLEPWLARQGKRRALTPYWTTCLAAAEMAANGVTATIQANTPYGTGDFADEIRSFARAYETVGLRAMVGIGARDQAAIVYPAACQEPFLDGLPAELRALLGDPTGSPYAKDAAATVDLMDLMQKEFQDSPLISFAYAPAGPQWVSDGMWKDLALDAQRRGVGIHTHAVESYAQAGAAAAIYPEGLLAHFEALGLLSERLSLAHAVWLTETDIRKAAAHGVSLVRNPGSNLRLRAGIAPLSRYLAAGVNVGLGSDSMTLHDDEDLFAELRLAMNLARSPMWDAPAPPDARSMLEMTTAAGARAMLLGRQTGALEVGRFADLIAVSLDRVCRPYLDPDLDLAAAIYARARGQDVRLTMVGGRIVYRDGAFALFDRDEVVRQVAEEAGRARLEPAAARDTAERLVDHIAAFYGARHARLRDEPWIPVADKGIWS